jgi:hypothetical protein
MAHISVVEFKEVVDISNFILFFPMCNVINLIALPCHRQGKQKQNRCKRTSINKKYNSMKPCETHTSIFHLSATTSLTVHSETEAEGVVPF